MNEPFEYYESPDGSEWKLLTRSMVAVSYHGWGRVCDAHEERRADGLRGVLPGTGSDPGGGGGMGSDNKMDGKAEG